jgi:AcrR family transcriptional regulator
VSPRPRRSHVVLTTTLDVIAEQGVTGISVDTVAARSGVSKATIYRHWGSRAHLIHAAISSLQQPTAEPDTGSLRGDLTELLVRLVEYFDTPPVTRVFLSFIEAAIRDPELAELRQETLRLNRLSFERVVRRGIDRGELPADIDVALVVDLVRSPIIYRRVVAQVAVSMSDVEPIINVVLAAFPAVHARS